MRGLTAECVKFNFSGPLICIWGKERNGKRGRERKVPPLLVERDVNAVRLLQILLLDKAIKLKLTRPHEAKTETEVRALAFQVRTVRRRVFLGAYYGAMI